MVAEHPGEALLILDKVNTAGFSDVDKAQAVYLRTRASAKVGLAVTWPDEMCEAAKILAEQTSDHELQAMAYYYAGYACFENDKLADAVREYRHCERILGDNLSKPLFKYVQGALYRCYYNQSLYEEATVCLRLNLCAAQAQCDTVEMIRATNMIAHINMIQENYDSAWNYYSQSQNLLAIYSHEEKTSLARCYNGKSIVLRNQGLLNEALLYNDTAMSFSVDRTQYYAMYLNRGDCYHALENTDSAIYYFNLSLASSNIELRNNVYHRLYHLYKTLRNDSVANVYADSSLYYQQLMDARLQMDGIKHSDEKHLMELYEVALQKERGKFTVVIGFVLFLGVGLLGCLMWWRNRKKKQLTPSVTVPLPLEIPESLISSLEVAKEAFEQTSSYFILKDLLLSEDKKIMVDEQENCRKELKTVLRPVLLELRVIERSITSDDSLFLFLCYMKISFSTLRRYLGMSERAPIQRKYRLKNKMSSNLYEFFFKDYK